MPRVSVLSPAFNHEKYVLTAVESVLSQTFSDFELILVDDGSTDQTFERISQISDHRCRFFKQEENMGCAVASERALKLSSGEYISWLNTDDAFEPNLLETLVEFLDSNPDALGVFGLARFMNEDGQLTGQDWPEFGVGLDRWQILNRIFHLENPYCAPAGMVRRKVLTDLGYFPNNAMQSNDMLLWIRILLHGPLVVIPDRLLRFRIRDGNMNTSTRTPERIKRQDLEFFEMLRLYQQQVRTVRIFEKIFPDIAKYGWTLKDELIDFYYAQIALNIPLAAHRLFAMHTLYEFLSEPVRANMARELCQFYYPDFFRLLAEKPTVHNDGHIAALLSELEFLRQENHSLRADFEKLSSRQDQLLRSLSWRLTKPLRNLKARLKKF